MQKLLIGNPDNSVPATTFPSRLLSLVNLKNLKRILGLDFKSYLQMCVRHVNNIKKKKLYNINYEQFI